MDKKLLKLKDFFKKDLLKNVLDFWYKNGVDWKNGGFTDFLDRDGSLLTDEKGGWIQGRATWIFSYIYNNIDNDKKWLDAAENCKKFLVSKCKNKNGRYYFRITGDGKPLVLRRYLFSECFAAIGLAEYSKASGDKKALEEAIKAVAVIDKYNGKLEPKVDPKVLKTRGHSMTMIVINLYQIMREITGDIKYWTKRVDAQINELFKYFIKPEKMALLETVNFDGSFLDSPEGRTINPGHAIETVWFVMEEARYRKDKVLLNKILPILDWSISWGWDKKYGGLLNFVDVEKKHPPQIEWEMKYWWPMCEMIYATLLAYYLTEDESYKKWFYKAVKWSYKHFPDKKYGEWFGYLRRDGTVSSSLKGNHFKGPFHIPRMEAKSYLLLKEMSENGFFNWG